MQNTIKEIILEGSELGLVAVVDKLRSLGLNYKESFTLINSIRTKNNCSAYSLAQFDEILRAAEENYL